MILAVDVDYKETSAKVAGVVFNDWNDEFPKEIYISQVENVQSYEPGYFYKRELPCILTLLNEHKLKPSIVVIDGYVFLDGLKNPGLGKYLFDALSENVVIIGVAKRPFKDISDDYALYRGESKNPLYVTTVGMDLALALKSITQMHGKYRIPQLLKKVDQICRGIS